MDKNKVDLNNSGNAERGGGMTWLHTSKLFDSNDSTAAHEVLHLFGIKDYAGYAPSFDYSDLSYSDSTLRSKNPELTSKMVEQIQASCDMPGALNKNVGPRDSTAFTGTHRGGARGRAYMSNPQLNKSQIYKNYIYDPDR